jgi:hypothetical protein|tara:strand:- start:1076 stop:1222 length:147 start_codon:yes stop_codon:yes gene_type:complete
MGTNYSQETAQSIIEQYKFRVEALSNKIEFLQAQIEISKQIFKDRING